MGKRATTNALVASAAVKPVSPALRATAIRVKTMEVTTTISYMAPQSAI